VVLAPLQEPRADPVRGGIVTDQLTFDSLIPTARHSDPETSRGTITVTRDGWDWYFGIVRSTERSEGEEAE
jgi:hypothetical protein